MLAAWLSQCEGYAVNLFYLQLLAALNTPPQDNFGNFCFAFATHEAVTIDDTVYVHIDRTSSFSIVTRIT